MKKNSLLMIVAAIVLSSCGITTQYTSTTDNSRFQDGIYSSSPSFRSKEERSDSRTKTDALIEETKASQIFLFGEKKDTVVIPQNMSASIRYDKSLASTVVTIGENPYAWENNLDLWSYYTPYSIGSSWYWSRHYDPWYNSHWYWNRWPYSSWSYYSGWYDPWYYGGYYDPWYYGGWYGYGYMNPYHCGWYHHHHHPAGPVHIKDQWHGNRRYTGSDRVFTSRVSTRAGAGTSSRVSRVSSSQTSGRANTSAVTSKRTAPTRVATSPARASASRKATVSNHRSPSTSVTRSSSSGTPDRRTSVRSTSSSSSYRSSSSSSYRSSSSSSSSRSSSYSTGSGRSYSSGGGGSMRSSGSGVSRSGGSTRR